MSALPASTHVFDVTEANFQTEVLDASFSQAVLVDLWAPWCEPCKILGPVLEKIVGEFNGAVRLAKVDCDTQPQIAGMFGARSIPTVVLLRDGQLVDAFTGALPESAVREFLGRHVQAAPPAADEAIAADPPVAETPEETLARIRREIAEQPDKAELKLDLAVAQMQVGDVAAAASGLDALPANLAGDDRATRLRGQLDFARALEGAPDEAELRARIARDPDDHAARDLLGVRLLLAGDAASGLEQFLEVLKRDRAWSEGQAKRRLIAAFSCIDDADLVGGYRRKMSSLLF